MSGVGSYMVQSLTINGVQRSLPTLRIFTESRLSLKDLEITTLKILSAASNHKYTLGICYFEKDIFCDDKQHVTFWGVWTCSWWTWCWTYLLNIALQCSSAHDVPRKTKGTLSRYTLFTWKYKNQWTFSCRSWI